MAWATIRRATDEDYNRLNERAAAFIKRHEIDTVCGGVYGVDQPWGLLEDTLDCWAASYDPQRDYYMYLRRLWRAVMRRVLGEPSADGIAWGHVGSHVD